MKQHSYTNKKVNYLYNIHDKFTAGIMLEGWEVKALDLFAGDINRSYCNFNGKDFCLFNSKITPQHNHVLDNKSITDKEFQTRRLLLNKSEIKKIRSHISAKGYTCVPIRLYRNNDHLWKIDIALVTGKNVRDKRQDLKDRDMKRDAQRDMKKES